MNGYSYLEDTQELKLEPFREFYQTLAEAKLESFQNLIKLKTRDLVSGFLLVLT